MASPQEIREWLRKMQYPDPNPSEEALQTLCIGGMGLIFQQLIERVKPRQDVEHTKKVIIVNKLMKNEKLKLSSSTLTQNEGDIEKIKLYNEKRKLEKQLHEINAQNIEDEITLEHLKAKIKSKNAKFQIMKDKIRESEKDIVLFKAKISSLQKQVETCRNLYEQSKILERNQIDVDSLPEKVSDVLAKLYDTISSFNPVVQPSTPDLTTISEHSVVGPLHTSIILSSNKKPLSSIKRAKRANSTRKNLAEITNNFSLISSTMRKKNISKISLIPSFNSTLSPTNSLEMDKKVEIVKELNQICWNNQSVMKMINELWQSDCDTVFKLLFDLKIKHKNKIVQLIAENDSGSNEYDTKSACALEKLHAFHVETEMKRMISDQEQNKIRKMLDSLNFDEDIPDIQILKATEHSLQNVIEHARNSIMKLKQDLPDNSNKLNQILDEIQSVQAETLSTKSKIETHLRILRESSSWINNHYKNIVESIRKPQLYSEYELLKSNIGEQDAKNFVSCPFQSQQTHYFNSWVKIYSNPELLELIQCPYLSPENTVKFHLEQKNWLHQLQQLQKETCEEKLSNTLAQIRVTSEEKQVNDTYKTAVEQLKAATFSSSEVLKHVGELDTELKYFLESSLNDFVAPEVKFENKTLKEYCEIYDSYLKLL